MMKSDHERNSISLPGAIATGTGVMIGAGIFALTGQIAELAGPLIPLSFVIGAIVTAFSAYAYIRMSNADPSAGDIAPFGVFRHLREKIGAPGWVLLTAIALDTVVLAAFAAMKWRSDPLIVVIGIVGMALVFLFVRVFLARNPIKAGKHAHHQEIA